LLLVTVTLSRPVHVWDVAHRRFVIGSSFAAQRGSLLDLRQLMLSNDLGQRGHISRMLRATIALRREHPAARTACGDA